LVEDTQKPGGEVTYKPAPTAFNTKTLLGLTLEAAQAEAARHGCDVVVSIQDGEGLPVPIDIDPKRIYVYIEGDVVTQIDGVGGGI
jgi:hypothetical protein